MDTLRSRLVNVALQWEEQYGTAPAVTSAVSEYDAALLIGMTDEQYQADCAKRTAVTKGYDFTHQGVRYQVKANRPSGKPGSLVTLVAKARNYDWHKLIWILYNRQYEMQEAWEWSVESYRYQFHFLDRLSPAHMRQGTKLLQKAPKGDAVPQVARNQVALPATDRVTGVLKQREMMRLLISRFGRNKERVCREYELAEQRGEVERARNSYGRTAEDYAQALWRDGEKKGWFYPLSTVPLG